MTLDEAKKICGSIAELLDALGVPDLPGAAQEVPKELETIEMTMRHGAYCAASGNAGAYSYESPKAAIVSLLREHLWSSTRQMQWTLDGRFKPVDPGKGECQWTNSKVPTIS